MNHLVSNLSQRALSSPDQTDPIGIAALDISNAFNTLSRAQMATVLQKGCDSLPGPTQGGQLGLNILWKHVQGYYGPKGNLKFYHEGKTFHINSSSGVQQGDPLGSVLFALALHPLLTKLAETHPDIFITAYADNIVFTGPMSLLKKVIPIFRQAANEVGLQLNLSESSIHVPKWAYSSTRDIQEHHVLHTNNVGDHNLELDDKTVITFAKDGIKLLGCPIGTPVFCQTTVDQSLDCIKADLVLLQSFPYLHQRMKLAIYCCNTRASYLLRSLPAAIIDGPTRLLDQVFDAFTAKTLSFEEDYAVSTHKDLYSAALCQSRLGIKQGGFGMTSQNLIAPAALFVALRDFNKWLSDYLARWDPSESLAGLTWLNCSSASTPLFPHAK